MSRLLVEIFLLNTHTLCPLWTSRQNFCRCVRFYGLLRWLYRLCESFLSRLPHRRLRLLLAKTTGTTKQSRNGVHHNCVLKFLHARACRSFGYRQYSLQLSLPEFRCESGSCSATHSRRSLVRNFAVHKHHYRYISKRYIQGIH